MRVAVGLAANDVLFPVVGFAFLYLLGLAASFGSGLRVLGLSYLTGWALLGSALSLGLMLGLPLTIWSVVAVATALVAACVLAGRHRRTSVPANLEPVAGSALNRWITRVGAAVLALGVLAAMVTAARREWNPASDYDALWFWLPKAAAIYYAHGLDPQTWHAIAHLEYPPLMPAMTAVTFAFTGGFHPSLIPFQQALLGMAFVIAVFALLDRFVPRWLSIPALALLGTAPWFWAKLESPMPDQTLAYLIAVAMLTSAIWLCEPRSAWLGLALVFLTAASLIKLEGVLFGAALAVVVIGAGLARYRRAGVRAGILLLGPGVIVLWHAWLSWNGLRGSSPDYDLAKLADPSFLEARTARLHYSLRVMAKTVDHLLADSLPFAGLRTLGRIETPFLVAGLCALLFFAGRRAPAVAVAVGLWLVLATAGLATIYWIGNPPIVSYVEVTVRRVEETPAMVTMTLLPLLLALALRATPALRPDRAEGGAPD